MAEDKDMVKSSMFDVAAMNMEWSAGASGMLCVAMRTDRLGYSRGNLVVPNISWGMPVQLNTVVGTPWYGNASTATPIDNMYSVLLTQRTIFGEDFDRITMSTAAFRAALSTTEFQNKAKIQLRSRTSVTPTSRCSTSTSRRNSRDGARCQDRPL